MNDASIGASIDRSASGLLDDLLPRSTFPPAGTPVVLAVSGGPDSLAMLALAVHRGLEVTAIHVDHRSRPDSADDADVVADVARRFGARFEARAVAAPIIGPNVEARWRAARRELLPEGAMTGHTADDQAESMLLNLMRGSGVDGLAGIRPGPTKPILRLRRSETRALCDELGLLPVEDASNADPAHRRNRVRGELVPLLDAIAERDVSALLARQADHLRDEADLLDELAAEAIPDATDARALRDAHPALARRRVRHWLRVSLAAEHPVDARAVDRVLAVASGRVEACEIAGAVRVSRSGMRLRLSST